MMIRIQPRQGRKRATRKSKAGIRVLSYLLLWVGVLGLGYYTWTQVEAAVYQDYQVWSFERALHGDAASPLGYVRHAMPRLAALIAPQPEEAATDSYEELPRATEEAQAAEAAATLSRRGGESADSPYAAIATPRNRENPVATVPIKHSALDNKLIGRLSIPRVQVTAIVRDGVDNQTLRRAVGHIPGTALPGDEGNVSIAGHRDSFFRGLRGIRKDDRIEFQTLRGTYEYVVDSLRIVSPEDVSVLRAKPQEQALTLITCFPFNYVGTAPKRFIVRARQVRALPPAQRQS